MEWLFLLLRRLPKEVLIYGDGGPITITVQMTGYGDRGSASATVYCNGVAVTSAGFSMSGSWQGWSSSGTGVYTPD